MGADEYAETPDSERAAKAIGAVERLLVELQKDGGMPIKISATKISRENFGSIADAAINKRASITAFGPIEKTTFLEMLNAAY